MTIIRIQTLTILLCFFIAACAKSNTRLGREEEKDAESIKDGGAFSDADPSSNGESSSGSDDPDKLVEAEDSGTDSISIVRSMDAGTDGLVSINSIPPLSVLVPEEDPEVREARLDLISEYCSLLEKFPCLDSAYADYAYESMEERIKYCEQDVEHQYQAFAFSSILSLCESEWEAVLQCTIEYDYSCPCPEEECILAHPAYPSSSPHPCDEAEDALAECLSTYEGQSQQFDVTGERLRCVGYLNPNSDHICEVICPDSGNNEDDLHLVCDGAYQGPIWCDCMFDYKVLYDSYGWFYNTEAEAPSPSFLPDCESATRAMADGFCHNITDCCFTWENEDEERYEDEECCGCTADPTQSETGATTCEELATALGGEVIDLCPYYKSVFAEPTAPPR